jgi:superfamily II RNA helicase
MLFATETFAVGVNMPTKTVLFTDIQKFAESQFRFLHPHEYTQMAGRAGRRGLDKVGHVIHLFNLYDGMGAIGQTVLKNVLTGTPQTLRSKYSIGYDTILNVAASDGKGDLIERSLDVAMNSMIRYEITSTLAVIDKQIDITERNRVELLASMQHQKIIEEYEQRVKAIESAAKKQKMRLTDELKDFIETAKRKNGVDINKVLQKKKDLVAMETELSELVRDRQRIEGQLREDVVLAYGDLKKLGLIDDGEKLTEIGLAARCFKEVDCLSFSVVLRRHRDLFESLSVAELVGFLSMFSIDKGEDCHVYVDISNKNMCTLVEHFEEFDIYLNREKHLCFMDWCYAGDDAQCKQIIADSGLYSGEFVKAVLKINNICAEIDAACVMYGYTRLAKTVSEVSAATLKSIATAQSLYL